MEASVSLPIASDCSTVFHSNKNNIIVIRSYDGLMETHVPRNLNRSSCSVEGSSIISAMFVYRLEIRSKVLCNIDSEITC